MTLGFRLGNPGQSGCWWLVLTPPPYLMGPFLITSWPRVSKRDFVVLVVDNYFGLKSSWAKALEKIFVANNYFRLLTFV